MMMLDGAFVLANQRASSKHHFEKYFLESRIEPENTNLFNEGSGFGVLITGMGRSRCEVGFAILDYTSMQLRLTEFIDTSCHSTILSKVDFQNMTSYWLKWQING